MTTLERTLNTGSYIFDNKLEFETFKENLSCLREYDIHYYSFVNDGKIDKNQTTWTGFGTSTLIGTVIFDTITSCNEYLATIAYLTEDRNTLFASLGWSITKEIID